MNIFCISSLTYLGNSVPLAGAEPLLEQVLVERVAEGAHRGVLLAPLTRLRVQVVRVQPTRPGKNGEFYITWRDA